MSTWIDQEQMTAQVTELAQKYTIERVGNVAYLINDKSLVEYVVFYHEDDPRTLCRQEDGELWYVQLET